MSKLSMSSDKEGCSFKRGRGGGGLSHQLRANRRSSKSKSKSAIVLRLRETLPRQASRGRLAYTSWRCHSSGFRRWELAE